MGKGTDVQELTAGLHHVFSELDVHRVAAYVHVDNSRSGRLLNRLGFALEGTLRATNFFNGGWHDHHLYALLQPDHVRRSREGRPPGT